MTVKEKFDLICERFNIKEYHIAGYKGQGVNIGVTESFKDDHGMKVYRTLKTYVPEANLYSFSDEMGFSATGETNIPGREKVNFPIFVEWCLNKNIDIVTCSQGWDANTDEEKEGIKKLYNAGIIFFNSAGNYGDEITLGKGKQASCIDEGIITVSSISIDSNGKIRYGSHNFGNAVDVLGVGENLPIQYENGSWEIVSGTSFATPLLASMFVLMKCAGINVNSKNAMDLIEIHSEELIYKDRAYNLFVLPPLVPFAELEDEQFEIKLDEEQINEFVSISASDWAKESWIKAYRKGIMDGSRPTDNITRQEIAVILDRLGLLE